MEGAVLPLRPNPSPKSQVFFFANGAIHDHVMYTWWPYFPYKVLVAKRGLTNWANVHTPM